MQLRPKSHDRYELLGVVSGGSICENIYTKIVLKNDTAVVYQDDGQFTDIRKHLNWIRTFTAAPVQKFYD